MPTPPHILRLRELIGHDTLRGIGAAAAILTTLAECCLGVDLTSWTKRFGISRRSHGAVEKISDALRRDVLEEAGLDVDIRRVIGVYSEPELAVTYPNGPHSIRRPLL